MSNVGVYPFAVSAPITPLESFRILMGDTDPVQVEETDTGTYRFISDAEATGLLAIYSDSPHLAAARYLETVAASQVLLLKVFKSADLSVDGAAIANSLRQLAKQIRDEFYVLGSEEGFEIGDTGTSEYAVVPEATTFPYYIRREWF